MYPKLTLADLLGDRVVYRNLVPADSSLPALRDVCQELGLEAGRLPRKTEPDYAAVIYRLLQAAQAGSSRPAPGCDRRPGRPTNRRASVWGTWDLRWIRTRD